MQFGRRLDEMQRRSSSIHWARNHVEAVQNVSLARLDDGADGADGTADPASNPPQPGEFLCNVPSSAPSAGVRRGRSALQAEGFGQAGRQEGNLHHVLLHDSVSSKGGVIPHTPSHVNHRLYRGLEYRHRTRYPHALLDVAKVLQRGGEGSPTRHIGPRTSAKTREWGRSLKTPRR